MSSNQKIANVERRTWDKETYEARAKARTAAAEAAASGASSAGVPRPALSSSTEDGEATSNKRPLVPEEEPEKEEFVPAATGAVGPERSKRAFLKARKNRVDLESNVGSSEIVSPDAVATTGGSLPSDEIKITVSPTYLLADGMMSTVRLLRSCWQKRPLGGWI